jgi:hypothetical protein
MQSEIDCFTPGTEVLVQELPEHCRVETFFSKWQQDWRNARLKRDDYCAHLQTQKKHFVFG